MTPNREPVRLRGHHLLCVLTFVGRGYSAGFVEDMSAVVGRIAAGDPVRIVDGPDDICAGYLRDDPAAHCRDEDPAARDAAALADASALLGTALGPGALLTLDSATLGRMRAAFRSGAVRTACAGCSWSAFCTGIAAQGYAGARLPHF